MINEFAIPQGSKLYFGANAKRKRFIENRCVEIFYASGFEEIATPYFSYHQTLKQQKDVIAFSDIANHRVSLRADSSQDVVRLITKRLGRSTEHQKWFYVQPVFRYPTTEIHQIGAEWTSHDNICEAASLCAKLLGEFTQESAVQLGNITVPQLIAKETGIDLAHFTDHNIEALTAADIPWLNALINVTDADELVPIMDQVSDALRSALTKLYESAKAITAERVIVTPLYHTELEYYDELFFRCLVGNRSVAMGGAYAGEEGRAMGFAIYTDELISE